MIKPELYKKTVDILFDAYFNNTLQHSNCHACAVGNIIARNRGISFTKNQREELVWVKDRPLWQLVHTVIQGTRHTRFNLCNLGPGGDYRTGQDQLFYTGYSIEQTAAIELAFETSDKGSSDEDYMFNGLVAVLEVLKQIHQVDDNSIDVATFESHRMTRASL